MLKNKRKPIFNKYKRNVTDNNDDLLNFDQMGFFDDGEFQMEPPPLPPEDIMAMQKAFLNPREVISTLLRDLGLTKPADMYMIDMTGVRSLTSDFGLRTSIEIKQRLLSILDLNDLLDMYTIEENLIISGFGLNKYDEWSNVSCDTEGAGEIAVVGHDTEEGLKCPECGTEYDDVNSILLAQTTAVSHYILNTTSAIDDLVKIVKPHISLTPICPNCYCDSAKNTLNDRATRNLSPVFIGTDLNRKMIPLLPKCFVEDIEADENVLKRLSGNLYWPRSHEGAICKEKRIAIEAINNDQKERKDNDS